MNIEVTVRLDLTPALQRLFEGLLGAVVQAPRAVAPAPEPDAREDAPAAEAERVAFGARLTAERRALIIREWPAGTPQRQIIAMLNDLPGAEFGTRHLWNAAWRLNLRRPPKRETAPVQAETVAAPDAPVAVTAAAPEAAPASAPAAEPEPAPTPKPRTPIAMPYGSAIPIARSAGFYSPTHGIDLAALNAARIAEGKRPIKLQRAAA